MKTVGFIGGGRITRILLQGFDHATVTFEKIAVFDTNEGILAKLKAEFPTIEVSATDSLDASSAEMVFVALHPAVLMECLLSIGGAFRKDALVVSLAPKITLEKLKAALPHVKNLARMNPNAGTFVNKGYNPVCFSTEVEKKQSDAFITMFKKLGKVPVVAEYTLEAYAVISAMGHTYFWFQVQQLKELAVSYGLSEKGAQDAISAMLWGTTETLFNSGKTYEEVCDLVPVKPMSEHENAIKESFKTSLDTIFQKIKPQ